MLESSLHCSINKHVIMIKLAFNLNPNCTSVATRPRAIFNCPAIAPEKVTCNNYPAEQQYIAAAVKTAIMVIAVSAAGATGTVRLATARINFGFPRGPAWHSYSASSSVVAFSIRKKCSPDTALPVTLKSLTHSIRRCPLPSRTSSVLVSVLSKPGGSPTIPSQSIKNVMGK